MQTLCKVSRSYSQCTCNNNNVPSRTNSVSTVDERQEQIHTHMLLDAVKATTHTVSRYEYERLANGRPTDHLSKSVPQQQ